MKKSDLKQLIREEIQNILKEYDYRNPGYPSSSDFNKIVRQTKSRYSKMFEIDIHERSVNILTDTGHEIEIVDRPETKTISVGLSSDNLRQGFILSKEYQYNEIDKVFKIIDMWLKKYEWLT